MFVCSTSEWELDSSIGLQGHQLLYLLTHHVVTVVRSDENDVGEGYRNANSVPGPNDDTGIPLTQGELIYVTTFNPPCR